MTTPPESVQGVIAARMGKSALPFPASGGVGNHAIRREHTQEIREV